ncbi:hypothetical protein [Actibacterium sp. 188UL27-1]|uniref:hypothetical protein n=1 Tax=Actibacterium sp. 188UL27-1 TaxID=2786961 RepID=UPI0019591231|nr:hypothetical protein [Actibacterium sp. 188UL27-1]MBM7069948.1 hypothetical protein [Actibacterium sp. 188UL27-1]
MKHEQGITAQGAEICGSPADHGIMKVEQSCASRALPTAKADLADGISRAEGTIEHPHEADECSRVSANWVGKEGAIMSDERNLFNQLGLPPTAKPSVEIDVAKYQACLDDPTLSDAQKKEIISALWSMMMAFVDLGLGVHPAQEVCGQVSQGLEVDAGKDSNESKPVDNVKDAFECASDDT